MILLITNLQNKTQATSDYPSFNKMLKNIIKYNSSSSAASSILQSSLYRSNNSCIGLLTPKRYYQWPQTIKEIKSANEEKSSIKTRGWVKSFRAQKTIGFVELSDGSTVQGLQVIGDPAQLTGITNGCCVEVSGSLTRSPGKSQQLELKLDQPARVIGASPEDYPLQPKHHSFEFLREIAHIRPRSNTLGSMIRVRNQASNLINQYFQERQFQLVHTPIITASDCEGGGEQFQVTVPSNQQQQQQQKQQQQQQSSHFFGEPAFLTVSGQLEAEIFASSHGRVYTFGPTFRAEKSNTTRHLSEFWMVEPEMAFINLNDNLSIAEDFIKYTVKNILEKCPEELEFFNKRIDTKLFERLNCTLNNEFIRLPYTDAVKILNNSFSSKIKWGDDLQREDEKNLITHFNGVPVFVIDWPKQIKPFYTRENDDQTTVSNMDLLVPEVGELIGGSIREERYEKLVQRIKELKMDENSYSWYLDLRKYGSAPHGGFGLGFERFLQYVTGLQNIRDVIPIPRHQNYCKF
ncbi:asparagine-tRNA ligase [Heterostelium album PN500]|uniref:asparagine--tRNA ligase n=1 Tax=Heterostelium pallidum (strain ATCC 26659 / Pp 5 / PN500) TaxID=670386 RepID=D3AYA4_HETP5|nr:asparagine-tRNA ligase [Heterostelium album PN500]EFA85931.1 asparagine-tRNA ligase [Heterostelium album PN500]|eukprot:XP_020438037.1 asparagine-tRNA ligase [Heterostelium album PN500]